jgi:hypothetical protein
MMHSILPEPVQKAVASFIRLSPATTASSGPYQPAPLPCRRPPSDADADAFQGFLVLTQLFDVPDGVQALEAVGTAASDYYALVFGPLVERVRRTGRWLRLLPGLTRSNLT